MQFRSIISLFIVLCIIVVSFFGNVVECGKVLDNYSKQNNINPNKNNFFIQRLRRKVRNTPRLYKRQYDNDDNNNNNDETANNDGNNAVNNGYQNQQYGGDQGSNSSGGDQN